MLPPRVDQGKIHVRDFEVKISEHLKSYITFPEATVGKPVSAVYQREMLDVSLEDPAIQLTLTVQHLNLDAPVEVLYKITTNGTFTPPIHGTYAAAVKCRDRVVSKESVLLVAKEPVEMIHLIPFNELTVDKPYNFAVDSCLNVYVIDVNYTLHCFDHKGSLWNSVRIWPEVGRNAPFPLVL